MVAPILRAKDILALQLKAELARHERQRNPRAGACLFG